jgi:hypothetical protein
LFRKVTSVSAKHPSFLATQWKLWLLSLPKRRSPWHLYRYPIDGALLAKNLLRHRRELSRPAPPRADLAAGCTVILLSHNRPQNMEFIVKSALANDFVRRVVVSNSNREVRIAEWIKQHDERLFLVDETKPTQPGHRFVLALEQQGENFLAVDDDIFLTPPQWADFLGALLSGESVPHGITGNIYQVGTMSSNGSPFHHVSRKNCEVDVLIGAYAFTRKQAEQTKILAAAAGFPDLSQVRNGEDILLSLAGEGRPLVHDLGRIFCCETRALEGVALSESEQSFWKVREQLYLKAAALQADLRRRELPTTRSRATSQN